MINPTNAQVASDGNLIREVITRTRNKVTATYAHRSWSVLQNPVALSDLGEVLGARYLCDLDLREILHATNDDTKTVAEDRLLVDLFLLETAKYRAANGRTTPENDLAKASQRIEDMLLQKNAEYGSAVFKKNSVFSPLTREQAIRVRLDDKLERLANQLRNTKLEIVEDTEFDIAGYLILMNVAGLRTEETETE